MQLNEPADALERFLRDRGQPVTVQRVIILAHRRSRLGRSRHPTVPVGTSTGYLLSLVGDSPDRLDAKRRASVQRLIRHDHDFHAKGRAAGSRGRPPAPGR